MRLAFISDIHGNATALDAVLEDIRTRDIDKIFVLGDICFRGPEAQRSLDLVRSLDTDVIKGNADEWVVRGVEKGEVPEAAYSIMNEERDWTVAKLDRESIAYLKSLPTELHLDYDNIKIHAFHATPKSLFEVVHPDETDENLVKKLIVNNDDISIYAHIHKPFIRYINGKCIINIGSVGLPFDGLDKSSYAVIDVKGNSFETSIVRVEYDINKVIQQFRNSDYPNKELMTRVLEESRLV